MNERHIRELAAYIRVLSDSAEKTTRAEDRSTYLRHLSEAAELLPALAADEPAAVSAWVDAASRTFGAGYLSGAEGDRAESAFVRLRDKLAGP